MSAGVLVVTADEVLSAAVPRLCALAGVPCEVEHDSDRVRAAWRDASAVVVGFDVAAAMAAAGLPRRERVFVLTTGDADSACWEAALVLGASGVLRIPEQQAGLVSELRARPAATGGSARVVAVIGGCGGAGASTFASALAITAARSGRALLVDGDPLGGGLDVLIGAESAPGLRWNELAATRGRLDAGALADAVCDVHGIGLLSWGRPGPQCGLDVEAVDAVLDAATRAFATVVIDVARGPGRVTTCLLDACDASVVVVPADVRAVAATAAMAAVHGRRLRAPHLVVRDAGGSQLSAKDVASSLGMSLAAVLRSDPAVRAATQRGEPPIRRGRAALNEACETVLSVVGAGDPS
ncbi:MAG TPA: septum site-determining protein Ssd [Mycobacteriales bacterium]|nr:septum site-determining protein Ssd [Mycobacteriales bacterium]